MKSVSGKGHPLADGSPLPQPLAVSAADTAEAFSFGSCRGPGPPPASLPQRGRASRSLLGRALILPSSTFCAFAGWPSGHLLHTFLRNVLENSLFHTSLNRLPNFIKRCFCSQMLFNCELEMGLILPCVRARVYVCVCVAPVKTGGKRSCINVQRGESLYINARKLKMIGHSPYDRCCRCWNVNRSPLSPGPGEETGRTERHDQASREGNTCIAFTKRKRVVFP